MPLAGAVMERLRDSDAFAVFISFAGELLVTSAVLTELADLLLRVDAIFT